MTQKIKQKMRGATSDLTLHSHMTPHSDTALQSERGFTLVEVLISIFIFALISVVSVSAMTSSLKGKARLNESLNHLSELQQMRALVTSDMANIILRQNRDVLGGLEPLTLSGGQNNLFEFTRGGRDNPGYLATRSDMQRVSYVFEDRRLIRRVMDHENPSAQAKTSDRILLEGLKNANILFHTGDVVSDRIERRVESTEDLPDMVEFNLVFENGEDLVQYFEVSL